MLSKIMKHEIKATYLYIVLLDVAAIIFTLLLVLLDRLSVNLTGIGEFFEVIIMMGYVVVLIGAGLCTSLIPAFRFYKSMFTDEGYLTNTLPVKSHTIIAGKALVYALWNIVYFITFLASISIFLTGIGVMNEVMEILSYFIDAADLTPGIWLTLLWGVIISLFFSIGMVYVSCAVGNLFANHKLIASIIAYFVLNQAMQIVSIVFMAILSAGNSLLLTDELAEYSTLREAFEIFGSYMYVSWIFLTLVTVLFFWLTNHIVSRKLNLQ